MTDYEFDPELLEQLRSEILAKQQSLDMHPADIGLKPLPIDCKMTSCRHGRHCLDYLRKPHPGLADTVPGSCRDCGDEVFAVADGTPNYGAPDLLAATCREQQHELIRAHYWTVAIDRRAYNNALRLGRDELVRRIDARVTAALTSNDAWSGRGASYAGDVVAYAQHATATCCRRCATYWHGLPQNRDELPTAGQIRHATWAARTWLDVRLPDLPRAPQTIAHIRQGMLPTPDEIGAMDDEVMNSLVGGADPAGLIVPEATRLSISGARSRLLVSRSIEIGA